MALSEAQPFDVELRRATLDQQPILANLLELYSYDFTEFWDFDIGDDGFYGYKNLPLYFQSPNHHPYLIFVQGKIAGLVFVQKGSPISDDPLRYDIAEFFVMRKFKRRGIGTLAALKIFSCYPGLWQVRCLLENQKAQIFWAKTLEKFQGFPAHQEQKIINEETWTIFHFESKSS